MANTLLIKGSKTATATPTLSYGADDGDGDAATEIAINRADGKLFYMDDSNQVTEFVSFAYGSSGSGNINADNIGTGTLPMARLSGTLPALNGSLLIDLLFLDEILN